MANLHPRNHISHSQLESPAGTVSLHPNLHFEWPISTQEPVSPTRNWNLQLGLSVSVSLHLDLHFEWPISTQETVSPTHNWNLQLGLSVSTPITTLNGQSPPEKLYLRLATG